MYDKKGFIMGLLSPPPKDIEIAQIDFATTTEDLTIADIFRNFNTLVPKNCRERYEIRNGYKAYTFICKSELLSPLTGLILIIGHNCEFMGSSRNYLIMTIDEANIDTEEKIYRVNESIIDYMNQAIREYIPEENYNLFYCKHLYNDYEQLRDNVIYS